MVLWYYDTLEYMEGYYGIMVNIYKEGYGIILL
jgi:hypothetical protein